MDKINELIWIFRFNYFDFQSRTSRADFWWYVLALSIAHFVMLLAYFAFFTFGPAMINEDSAMTILLTLIGAHFALIALTFIPTFAIMARRLHDTHRTARWLFLFIIPGIWPLVLIFLIFWFAEAGDSFGNKYGPVPNSKKLKNPQVASEF